MPRSTDMRDVAALMYKVALKPLAICKAVTAGKINSADTSMIPAILTDKITVIAVRIVRRRLMK